MSSLFVHRVSFAHSDAVPLFSELELRLGSGWTGVVGANGSGKTTLLRLLAGELRPDEGHIRLEPASALVVTCEQEVEQPSAAIEMLAHDEGGNALELMGRLGLSRGDLARWPTLSPGERKRWQIAAALSREPDVLLLDEPTNHLDRAARRMLSAALARFDGIGVIVSHDRQLMNELTRHTLRVVGGSVRAWRGAYDQAREGWLAHERALEDEVERRRDAERKLDRRLADARRDLEATQARRSSRKRMKGKHDGDGRSSAAKVRVENADKSLGRRVTLLRREHERAGEKPAVHHRRELGSALFVGYQRAPSPWLFRLEHACVEAGGRRLLEDVSLALGRESRIRLEGVNGSGKTTLLRTLIDEGGVGDAAHRVLYVPQEIDRERGRKLLAEVRCLAPEVKGRVLSLVAALGVDPEHLLASDSPSPGESRKLMIALGLGRHLWALVLDEPTNHMDLPSLERLEQALEAYPGALLLVSHDPTFARGAVSTEWRLAEGRVHVSSLERKM
jgi:ATPase subunit of ABC transporter with duplicated ATPase domains